jgi:hypothetical protein
MTYDQFWLLYLRAHARRQTRTLHYIGSVLALVAIGLAVLFRFWPWLIAAPVLGYGFAWVAHLGIEHNKPTTFGHPFWSLASDFRMLSLYLSGRLHAHLARAGLQAEGGAA